MKHVLNLQLEVDEGKLIAVANVGKLSKVSSVSKVADEGGVVIADVNTNFINTKLVLKQRKPKQAGFQATNGNYTTYLHKLFLKFV